MQSLRGESLLEFNEKFCPVCKNKIERKAVACTHCGVSLDDHYLSSPVITLDSTLLGQFSAKITNSPIDDSLIPDGGIAVYAAGSSEPVYLQVDSELILGRKGDGPSEDALLDLSELGGYQAGISRRHAVIRRRENGYEIVDLASTNGSWLNNERLVPNKPVPLASGSQLLFGHMQLLVMHHCSTGKQTAQLG
jgi:hypothetical protein